MKDTMLRTPEMAIRLAEILFPETNGADELQWFLPFRAEDDDDVWFVTGNGDGIHKRPPDPFNDQFENESFYLHVAKADAEVKDVGVEAGMKLLPEAKAQIRALIEAERKESSVPRARRSRDYRDDLFWSTILRGGVINSSKAAIQFGELIFENHFDLRPDKLQKMYAEEVDGLWHVYGDTDGRSAELVFRRSNAQVISLDLRPAK